MSTANPEPSALPWGDGPYSIKRHGVTLPRCEDEPVRTPGCIQSHGALVVVRASDLCVVQVSENTARHLGRTPEELIGRPLGTLVGDTALATVRQLVEGGQLTSNPRFLFVTTPPSGPSLDVTAHATDGLVLLEFEPSAPEPELPSRALDAARAAVLGLDGAGGLYPFLQRLTEVVRGLTGLSRVMVYRFHPDFHGEVVAESQREDLGSWLGFHYPASDIPAPVRALFRRIWSRPLPDATAPLAEVVPLANPVTGRPLDLTHCALRGASVMYTEYLANMGVAASLTMPLMRDGELWGLIACHNDTPTRFPFATRATCELIAQVASLQLRSIDQAEVFVHRLELESVQRAVVARTAVEHDVRLLIEGSPSLLDGMEAGGVALRHLGQWVCRGQVPSDAELDDLAQWLQSRPQILGAPAPVFATDALSSLYPPGAAFADRAAGVLVVSLSPRTGDLLLWFRPEVARTIRWAGDPADKPVVPGPNGDRMTPRRSFELYLDTVHERAAPWSVFHLEAAQSLRVLLLEVVVARIAALDALNGELTRSNVELDAFAAVVSHDLKEPLRGIQRNAHELLDLAQGLDEASLTRVQSVTRIATRMDSLVDSLLRFARIGRSDLEIEPTPLDAVVDEALDLIGASRRDSTLRVERPRPLPVWHCDGLHLREIYTNLLSNAIRFAGDGPPRVEIGYLTPEEARGATPAAAGHDTVFFVRDHGIGIDSRHFHTIFRMFKRIPARGVEGTGLGLSIVQRLVARHGGVVWVTSTVGVGSTFWFTLPVGAVAPR